MMSESAEPLLGFNSVTTANNREDDDESESESRLALSEQHGTSTDTPRSLSLTTEEEFFCGCGPCHPPWLQWLRDARVFTALLCLFSTIEGALVSGFTSVVLSTIEKRYRLPSTATGALASTIDVAVLSSVIFISYIGGRGHKPRWLGVALIIEAVGAFVFSLPQFVLGRYEVGASGDLDMESCADGNDFSSDCASSNNAALAFFLIGNILIGVGAAPLFTIGTSYLDDIVHPKYVSIHLGAFYALAIVGPALGFGLGGLFLSVYVDPSVDTHLDPSDPGWVGAWWLCYIFSGVVSLVIAVPFFFYPRLPPNSEEIRLLKEREMGKKTGPKFKEDGKLCSAITNFPLTIKEIITNPSWWCITAAITIATITVSGFASFGAKYVENQFGLPSSTASLLVGVTAIPSGGAGVVVGGLIIFCTKVKGRNVPLVGLLIAIFAALPLSGLLIHCPTLHLAGVTVPYPDGTVSITDTTFLLPNCTSSCDCTSSVFEPVCGADNIVYFSACQAGCPPNSNQTSDYTQCSCIAEQLISLNSTSDATATNALCDRGCKLKLVFFLLLVGLALFLLLMLQVPNVLTTIRCVSVEQSTLALGLQSCLLRLCGSVPGPIVFGAVFDSACLFWQRDCGHRGNCWVYDNTALSTRVAVLAVGSMVGYIVFLCLCWLLYPRQLSTDKEEEQLPLTECSGPSSETLK